ncbi:MAG: pyruvate, phosphate dikinase, partial [Aquabacterium sp.]|nr:pyruvate, phosphate dikinase [Aquabacterium sp.]
MKRDAPTWPQDLFLIGCGAEPDAGTPADARSMGVKAHNLLRMARLGLRVPPAFVIGTRYCATAAAARTALAESVWRPGLQALQQTCGQRLGDARQPLLLSVRSGAPVSMPGMMETLLNIGLCDLTAPGLLRQTGDPRLVWDAYRRLVATHGEVVAGLPAEVFEHELAGLAGTRDEHDERELDFAELRELTRRCLAAYRREAGRPFPQDPHEQLASAIDAVLASWHAPKAADYRRQHGIDAGIGTAVTVQAMVFGNAGGASGAGVGFTRDPSTGERRLWVDFLFNAQGEDVVSGRRSAHGHDELAQVLPAVWRDLQEATDRLEAAFGDMQDFEFTVQDATLYLLQTRNGKRMPQAAARIALDLLDEGRIDLAEARRRTA